MVLHHLLAPPRSLPAGSDSVARVFDRLGSIQFDPLEIAGRNHDLVLLARVDGYRREMTDRLLYEERCLYETYNKGLSIVPTAELPYYRITWDLNRHGHEGGAFDEHAPLVEELLERIRSNGPLSPTDIPARPAIDWYWRPTNQVRAILEALAEAGILGLARREGNRRVYDLVERLFPADLLAERRDEPDQRRHKLLSRYRAHGLLGGTGSGELWYGTGRSAAERRERRQELLGSGQIVPVAVDGVRGERYVLGSELELLETARREVADEAAPGAAIGAPGGHPAAATFLAPLDPLVWDRDFLRAAFDFDYVWEVYVPEAKRRWGYYVLPILFGDRLVGRIEPRLERKTGDLRVIGLWWEEGFDPVATDGFVDAFTAALVAHARFAGLERIVLPRESKHRPVVGAVRERLGRGGRIRS